MGGIYKNHLPLLNLSSQPQGTKPDKGMGISNLSKLPRATSIPLGVAGAIKSSVRDTRYQELDQAGELSYRDDVTFDPEGLGTAATILWHTPEATAVALAAWEAKKTTEEHYEGNYSSGKANAFLHAYLSYRLTKALGPTIARRFTDANEVKPLWPYGNIRKPWVKAWEDEKITWEEFKEAGVSSVDELITAFRPYNNPPKEMKADLFNNGFGRRLYIEGLAKNDQEAIEMIMQAIERGNLSVIN